MLVSVLEPSAISDFAFLACTGLHPPMRPRAPESQLKTPYCRRSPNFHRLKILKLQIPTKTNRHISFDRGVFINNAASIRKCFVF